jgi:hypothetical protein
MLYFIMKKVVMTLTLLLVILFSSSTDLLASGFHLKSIGSVETGGRQISHWWYSSPSPVFHGEALPGANINADIDGTVLQLAADSAGNWNFAVPSALTTGDHKIIFTSEGSTIDFTLTIGTENVNWDAVGKGGEETMPTVGTTWPTILTALVGVLSLAWGGKMVFNVNRD